MPYYKETQTAARGLDSTLSQPSVSSVLSSTPTSNIKNSDGGVQSSIKATTEAEGNTSLASRISITSPSSAIEDEANSMLAPESNAVPPSLQMAKTYNSENPEEKGNLEGRENVDCLEIKNIQVQMAENGNTVDDPTLPVPKDMSAVASVVALDNRNQERLQLLMNRQCTAVDSVTKAVPSIGIPHMITTSTEPGKLPLFPSWALTQLGSSSIYAHSSGVNQPGFISNNRNLLPWDVPLKNTEWTTLQKRWPNLAENASKKSSFNPNGKGADMGLTVKVFVGLEYECPRGHRLIASSPGKTKSMTSSITNRMVNSDAPLYIECNCTKGSSTAHPVISQLVRIHIVTPKAPIHITLNPRVIPCPDGPTFHPGWHSQYLNGHRIEEKGVDSLPDTNQIKLPISTYWVLRLPFIYWGKQSTN